MADHASERYFIVDELGHVVSRHDEQLGRPLETAQGSNADEEHQLFVYKPLTAGKIRLLRILADRSPQIEAKLVETDINYPEKYCALSYVWGNPTTVQSIKLEGRGHKRITWSLFEALKAIRRCQEQLQEEVLIWIDALCINQDDLEEKGAQIPLMGQIYTQAHYVFIVLRDDPADDVVRETLYWLHSVHKGLEQLRDRPESSSQASFTQQSGSRTLNLLDHWRSETLTAASWLEKHHGLQMSSLLALQNLVFRTGQIIDPKQFGSEIRELAENGAVRTNLPAAYHTLWPTLLNFFHQDWFRRIWTYQEVLLAKQPKVLFKDGRLIDWIILKICHRAVLSRDFREVFFSPRDFSAITFNLTYDPDVSPPGTDTQFILGTQSQGSLGEVLTTVAYRQATNPKDNVYGGLGLVDEITKSSITIDYTITDAVVFQQALKVAARSHPEVLPLLWQMYGNTVQATKGLASWCPDFSVVPGSTECLKRSAYILPPGLARLARCEDVNDPGTIGFLGVRLDTVTVSTSKCPRFDPTRTLHRDGLWPAQQANPRLFLMQRIFTPHAVEWLRSLATMSSDEAEMQGSLHGDLLMFVTGGDYVPKADPTFSRLLTFCNFFTNVTSRDELTLEELLQRSPLEPYELGRAMHDMGWLRSVFGGHHVFKTASGRFGVAARSVKTGDQVVWVPGGDCVHVLSSGCDRYVNCASVEGLAENVLLPLLRTGKPPWEYFYIS